MDTRRCALFLIKCVQGFAAIFRKWMTWKCNFQCISLLFSFFHVFLYSSAPQLSLSFPLLCHECMSTQACLFVSHVTMCKTVSACMSSYLACICLTHPTGHECAHSSAHPKHLTGTLHSCCATLDLTPLKNKTAS